MSSDQVLPRRFAMQVEAGRMTIDQATSSGLFDMPDELGMVRIPISVDVMIPWHLLQPPEPAAGHGLDNDPSSAAGDEADRRTDHQNAIAAENVAASFRTMAGPAAAEEAASFREMLKATRTGRGGAAPARPPARTDPGGQASAVAQGLPTLPVAGPIDTTDIDLPRIVVEGSRSGVAPDRAAAPEAELPHHAATVPARADGGGDSGGGPGPVGSLPEPVDPGRWAGIGAGAGGLAGVAVGGEVGAVAGAAAGATGGTLVVPGVGTVGGAVVGAVAGAAEGAAVAGAAGAVVGGEAGRLAGEFVNYIEGGNRSRSGQGSQQKEVASDGLPAQDPEEARAASLDDIQKGINKQKKPLDDAHLDAARRERKGEVVKINPRDGQPYDHEIEVKTAQNRLVKIIRRINNRLGYPHLDPAERVVLTDKLAQASRLSDHSENSLQREPHD